MSIRNLSSLFEPTHVAVVGAGADRAGLGHLVLRNLVGAGFEGVVYPINPGREAVGGIRAYASVAAVPATPDLAVVCVPAPAVPAVVRECGEAGVLALAVISAGFRESGPAGRELEENVAAELARYDGMRLLGPNCLGLIVPRIALNASFAGAMPADGSIAFVSQSGALATAVIDWARAERIGFSHVVSLGNTLDVDLGDVIDYLGRDTRTRSIILYIEAVTAARKFMSAARAFARTKPIIVYKAGRFRASAQAAVSHTGAMAGEDAVHDAAFRRAGLVRVGRIEDVFSTAELLARERPVRRGRLAIVTNAGGPGVMAADALIERGGALAELSPASIAALDAALPAAWSRGNPIDVLGDAPPERFAAAVRVSLADDGVDGVLAILAPQAMTHADAAAQAVLGARPDQAWAQRKPLLAAWMGGEAVRAGRERLTDAGVATYAYPEQAIGAFMDLVSYAANLETLYETPRTVPVSFELDRDRARERVRAQLEGSGGEPLSEIAAKAVLAAYGIPVTRTVPASSAAEAVAAADELGYPVALKVLSPQLTHKSDAGGVELGLASTQAVRSAYERILATVSRHRPDAEVEGVTVQPMAVGGGLELVLGARRDASFGAVIMLGAGGVAAEVLRDRALDLPPLNEALARKLMRSLRIWPLLAGHRGAPGVDVEALLEVLVRFSHLVADAPEIAEIEINPLLAGGQGALALDARAAVARDVLARPPAPFSHLAIRPYPDELTRAAATREGLDVTLRAIRPEDEPRWHEMLDACSADTIHARFRNLVKHTHQMATRYCFIDYDRELAIVAELRDDREEPRLAGIVRLVADPDHERAEYAILVADPWQGHGLGDLLTAYGLEVARAWGIRTVYAETEPGNTRMLAVLRKHGFMLTHRSPGGVVAGERAP